MYSSRDCELRVSTGLFFFDILLSEISNSFKGKKKVGGVLFRNLAIHEAAICFTAKNFKLFCQAPPESSLDEGEDRTPFAQGTTNLTIPSSAAPTWRSSHQPPTMRQLTEKETQTLFAKLANYTGSSLKNLITPLGEGPNADRFVFRLHKDRVYYVRLSIANIATSIARDKFISMGVCLGSFLPNPAF